MKKLLVLAAALAVVLTMFSFPVVAMANFNTDTTTPSAPAEEKPAEVNTSFIEPNYYPDYDEKDDTSEAPVIRDESDTAPKTADAPILPTLLLAALSALVLVRAKKRLCR